MTPHGVRIVPIPPDEAVRWTAATWSASEWAVSFPDDSAGTYMDLYAEADKSSGLPVVVAAMCDTGLAGTASLVADDELPDAVEKGPWVAAVFVAPLYRGRGIGQALVRSVVECAHRMGFERVYLYTDSGVEWYIRMGWEVVRTTMLREIPVTVMLLDID